MLTFLKKRKNSIVYIATILLSAACLVAGGIWARYIPKTSGEENSLQATAVVKEILDTKIESYQLSGEQGAFDTKIIAFRAFITSGELSDTTVTAFQQQDNLLAGGAKDVETGDKVLIDYLKTGDSDTEEWIFVEYHRSNALIWLCAVFFILLIVFGWKKGIDTIVSLVLTVLAVFVFFIPSILSGKNVYITSIITCLFAIIATHLIITGTHKKTICAVAGCVGGLAVTGILTFVMSNIMHLTGVVDEQSTFLITMNSHIDLKAIIFGAILVGALGAVMDVSMSLASSLFEVSEHMGEHRNAKELIRSGLNIGRDIMGTMANTLILAYIGSSLSVVLLLVANNNSLLTLFNIETVVVEVLQALVGSLGILSTIPITSLLAAYIYTRVKNGKKPKKERLRKA